MMLLGSLFVMFIMFFVKLFEVNINALQELRGCRFLKLDSLNITDGHVSEKDANYEGAGEFHFYIFNSKIVNLILIYRLFEHSLNILKSISDEKI